MIRYALAAALIAVLVLGGMVWHATGKASDLEARNRSLQQSVDAMRMERDLAREAAAKEAIRAGEARQRAKELNDLIDSLKDVPDAPLDPALIDRLRVLHGPR